MFQLTNRKFCPRIRGSVHPCGYYKHPEKECSCSPEAVQKYLNKISRLLLDQIDLHIEVPPVNFEQMASTRIAESSVQIQERVIKARQAQTSRFMRQEGVYTNAMMSSQLIKEICIISDAGKMLLKKAMERLGLSYTVYDHVVKLSRTIADLSGSEDILIEHLAEAIQYRSLDRKSWGDSTIKQ